MSTPRVERVDDIPLIFHWLMQMRVAQWIDELWPVHGNWQGLSYGQLAVLFITYVVHSLNHRLSGMEAWVESHREVLRQVTGWELDGKQATDDRLGLLLEALGEDEQRGEALQQGIGRHLIRAYELPTEMGRYDTTTFNVYHQPPEGQGLLRWGHSKDRRPDLVQFKQGVGTLDPAGVPLVVETLAGNSADDPRYGPVWRAMAETLGHRDFVMVGDTKGAALETRATLSQEGGYYLFPLPMTGRTPEQLSKLLEERAKEACSIVLADVLDKEGKPRVIGKGFEVEHESVVKQGKKEYRWQERWLVIRSDSHARRQRRSLEKRLEKAERALDKLHPKAGESAEEYQRRAQQVLEKQQVTGLIEVRVEERRGWEKRYQGRGRPGPKSAYEWVEWKQLWLHRKRLDKPIEAELESLGWRIYVTNTPSTRMSLVQSVNYYRDQWTVERGFHRLKRGSVPVLPLFVRLPERIKGLMMLLMIALQAIVLIEFVVRRELANRGEKLSGTVPGNPKMSTQRPTAERLLAQFKELHLLMEERGDEMTGRLVEQLTPLQRTILELLKVPVEIYELSFARPISDRRQCGSEQEQELVIS